MNFPIKVGDGKMSIMSIKNFFVPKLEYCQFQQDKKNPFSYELVVKYFENLSIDQFTGILNDVK